MDRWKTLALSSLCFTLGIGGASRSVARVGSCARHARRRGTDRRWQATRRGWWLEWSSWL